MHPQGCPSQSLEDTTYHTGIPCSTPDSLHTAGTLKGGAEKAEMLQNDYLQEIGYHSSLDMLVRPIHLYLSGKQHHDWNNHTGFPKMHRTLPGLPQVCYTGGTGHSATCKTFLSLCFFSLILKTMLLTVAMNFIWTHFLLLFCILDFICLLGMCLLVWALCICIPPCHPCIKQLENSLSWPGLQPYSCICLLKIQLFYASLDLCILL